MSKKADTIERERVVVRFSGDSGDGMQLTGTLFSDTSAYIGNDLSTFPDYPSEIRAPQGTIGGVSGFQVHIGHSAVKTPGDYADILVAMNPAALRATSKWVKEGENPVINMAIAINYLNDEAYLLLAPNEVMPELPWHIKVIMFSGG